MPTLRPPSVPESVGLFGATAAAGAALWPSLTNATGLGLPCPLRALTGIPCPFCGGTTAAVDLVRGRFGDALATSPLVVLLAVVTVVMAAVLGLRLLGRLPPPRRRSALTPTTVALGVALLVASEAWQLARL